jgi:multiple sugar transport system permease protein
MKFSGAKNKLFPYYFMLPALILVVFITVYPVFFAVEYSLYKTQIFTKLQFVGLKNYIDLFTDPRFHRNVLNSFVFVFGGVALALIFGVGLALLLREKLKTNFVYRTVILVPWATNRVASALMWRWLLNGQFGPISFLSQNMGFSKVSLLQDPLLALPTVTLINVWRATGFSLVIMLAALSAIPKEVEEAAKVDGCSVCNRIRYIILPLIRPTLLIAAIVITIGFFNVIVLVLDLTGGGPMAATELISLRLYKEGFQYLNLSTASSITLTMLIMQLLLAWAYLKILRSEPYY